MTIDGPCKECGQLRWKHHVTLMQNYHQFQPVNENEQVWSLLCELAAESFNDSKDVWTFLEMVSERLHLGPYRQS
jgi:hypothetical protein